MYRRHLSQLDVKYKRRVAIATTLPDLKGEK